LTYIFLNCFIKSTGFAWGLGEIENPEIHGTPPMDLLLLAMSMMALTPLSANDECQ
jgi:hypothetical protein